MDRAKDGHYHELPPEYNYLFKVLLVGDLGVGKSTMKRGLTEGFPPPPDNFVVCNMGLFSIHKFQVDDSIIKVQLWEPYGGERYRNSISPAYYRGCLGMCLVYDITREETFTSMGGYWLEQVRMYAQDNTVVMVLGNKCDLFEKRQVSAERGRMFAEAHGLRFMETSAHTGENVEEALLTLCKDMKHTEDTIVVKSSQSHQEPLQSYSSKCTLL